MVMRHIEPDEFDFVEEPSTRGDEKRPVHQELDAWAFEIEQAIKNNTFEGSRGRLQRKLMAIWKARDKAYTKYMKYRRQLHHGYQPLAPLTCKERMMFTNPGIVPPPYQPPPTRLKDEFGRTIRENYPNHFS